MLNRTQRTEMGGSPTSDPILWVPSAERKAGAQLTRYLVWLERDTGRHFASYDDLWLWSVTDLEGFWSSIWRFFDVISHQPYSRVLAQHAMPGAAWFSGTTLNYAEHALRRRDDHLALIFWSERGSMQLLTYAQLGARVAAVAAGLKRLGVTRGDRVVAYLPNIPEAVIAFLATASLGAVWSSCPPEFGTRSVVDRFQQIAPRVLIAADGYRYGGEAYGRLGELKAIQQELPTLAASVVVPYLEAKPALREPGFTPWSELIESPAELEFEPVPFDHPLWILYSSGTTGLPKAIVQGHGGILLEHMKALCLHLDLHPSDRFFWFTSTGWMMWNFLVGGLLLGCTVLLYDGSPGHPDLGILWRFAELAGATYFGTSAAFIQACMSNRLEPGAQFDLHRLRGIGSTGSPLTADGFRWVYDKVGQDLLLGSLSGGTDVCTAFVLPCPLKAVRAGEIQCRGLGASVEAFDPEGKPVIGRVGELVLTEPLPSMPLYFWADGDGRRYRESYFDVYPGVWRHGDWVTITKGGSCVISGRSDSTLNRGGVRMGTSEFYRLIEEFPEVADSLIIDTGQLGSEGRLLLFLVLKSEDGLTQELDQAIRARIRHELSPRHVPDEIHAVADIPRTLTGKKLELPVRRIILGEPPEKVASAAALSNPESLQAFAGLVDRLDAILDGREPESGAAVPKE